MDNILKEGSEPDSSIFLKNFIWDSLNVAWRWKWFIFAMIFLGTLIGGGLAWNQKDMFRSSTVILVEQQKITEDYVRSVVGGSVAERVSTITQQLLSRTNLQKIIDEFSLFPNTVKNAGYEPVIKSLRSNIKIEIKGMGVMGQVEAFTISFAHHDPMMAMKVTAKLASQYIEENLKIREQFIEGATDFLEQELHDAKVVLDEKEKALSQFKLAHMGELPAQLETNLRALDRFQEEKTRIAEAKTGINVRLELLQKSIKEYEAIAAPLAEMAQMGLPMGGVLASGDPLTAQLNDLQREYEKFSMEYTDAYPDVVLLKSKIEHLKEELASRSGKGPSSIDEEDLESLGTSETQIEIPTFDPYINDLQISRNELKAQLASLSSQSKNIKKQMGILEQRLSNTPIREQELLVLERDYANMQEHYQRLYENKINSRISGNLEKRQKGERFRILDPANLPTQPEGLPRFLIGAGGVLIGGILGFGIAFLVEFLSPTLRRAEDAEVALGLPMLATIPSFKMAYGKSMKLIPGDTEAPRGVGDGAVNGNGTQQSDYFEKIPNGKPRFYRTSFKASAFPAQLNLVTKWRPDSVVAEQFRVAATRLDLMGDRPMGNVVLISSAMKGEGKTSTAANLGYTLARDLDEPTLIIDCDYKCPNLHNVLMLKHYPGVADYLAGEAPLELCIQPVQDIPLWCMPVGDTAAYPVSLSKLQHLASLLESVRSRYRFIILDGPPILPLADINVLNGFADMVLMVVRSGVTPKDVVQKATEMIHGSKPKRLVLTDAWSQGVPYYVRHGYSAPYSLSSSE